jgi:hypothetical protein
MGKPKAPKAPDPRETSAASTGTNVGTAVANAWLQNPSEITPDGKTSVTQTGAQKWTDSYTGQSYDIPTFTRTTTLSPEQQAIKDQQDQASLGLSTLGNKQTQFLQDYMSKPFDGTNDATEARLIELGKKRLDPMLARQDEDLRARLANQGIKVGSAAYDREMETQNNARNDANNQLILGGNQQAFAQGQATRNQPLNEIIGLLNGSQVSQPQFQGANIGAIPTTDVAGVIQQDYQNRMGAYNQQMAARNNILGGLFGLGSSFIKASDERVKEDIKPAGKLMGHNIYSYDYKGKFDDGKRHVGVMAQEVERKRPDAVLKGRDGVKRVNYGKLFQIGARAA